MVTTWFASFMILAADPEPLPAKLAEHDLERDGTFVVLADEGKVHAEMTELRPRIRRLNDLQKKFRSSVEFQEGQQADKFALRREHTALTDALANLPAGDIARHNQLVVRINQITAMISRQSPDDEAAIKKARSDFESARAGVIKELRSLGPRVARLTEKYEELAKDQGVLDAIAELPPGAAGPAALGPGRNFKTDRREIDKLLKRLQSSEIPLRNESGVRIVDVILNDDTHAEFVLDTGAGMICLPFDLARRAGAEPTDSDPSVMMKIANGDTLEGKLIKVKSVRVGPFELNDVECAVLPRNARDAEPLLGNSFLGQFEHQIDPANNKLILSRWGDEKPESEPTSTSRSKRKSRAKRHGETP
jgi:clan AA aspartic protease (TIGR02281 family)